jgi:hypothetical protein
MAGARRVKRGTLRSPLFTPCPPSGMLGGSAGPEAAETSRTVLGVDEENVRLASLAKREDPSIGILFMPGFTESEVLGNGVKTLLQAV